jgi:hypothetical protein
MTGHNKELIMINLKNIAVSYFKRKRLLRFILIVTISLLWAYSEYTDFYEIPFHDLNYKALQEISSRDLKGQYSFAVVGDPKNSPVFDDIVHNINQDKDISFVTMLGDLVMYPTVETYRSFLEQRAELHAPALALPGNHDVAFKDHYFYHTIFGRFYYSFAIADTQFILLDNSNMMDVDEEQLAWLEKQLKAGQVYKNRFVFMHVPLWDPRGLNEFGVRFSHSMNDPDAARKLEDIFKKNKVTLLFEGHIHAYYDLPDKTLHRIISGGGGAALSGTDPEHAFHHYLKVTLSDNANKISTEVVRLDNKKTKLSITKYLNNALLYVLTFLKLYKLQIILGTLVLILLLDALLEYFYLRRSDITPKS